MSLEKQVVNKRKLFNLVNHVVGLRGYLNFNNFGRVLFGRGLLNI